MNHLPSALEHDGSAVYQDRFINGNTSMNMTEEGTMFYQQRCDGFKFLME